MRRLAPLWAPCAIAALTLLAGAVPTDAQVLGTFSWQLQPFCNVITVRVTQQGAWYTVDGFDDQCGAPQRAPLVGAITPNPDGSIGLGLQVVTVPGGRGLQIDARIALATLGGPWSDSSGNSGALVFGAATGGSPRPLPTGATVLPGSITSVHLAPGAVGSTHLAPASVTSAHLAPGAVGAGQLAAGAVTATHLAAGAVTTGAIAAGAVGATQLAPNVIGALAQARITGVCAVGQSIRGVNADGSVVCSHVTSTADEDISGHNVGLYASAAIGIDGLPVVAHFDMSITALRVTHCGNPACSQGNVTTTVDDPVDSVGWYASLAIGTDGLPVIAHFNLSAKALRVTHCTNLFCTAATSLNVDDPTTLDVGEYASIAIGADGLPIISHRDATNAALRVTHCGTVACTSANTSITVDNPANIVAGGTSIAIGGDGLPIISHQDVTAGTLRITHCGNAICSFADVAMSVDDPAFVVGADSSIAIGADGFPVIGHRNVTAGAARVTHCQNRTCNAGATSLTVDNPPGDAGYMTSLAIAADGLALVSHVDLDVHAVRVVHCGNAACSSGNVVTVVDDTAPNVTGGTGMAVAPDGLPLIAYGFGSPSALRVTRCGTVTCQ